MGVVSSKGYLSEIMGRRESLGCGGAIYIHWWERVAPALERLIQ
jgi:hypothetical protein